MARLHRGAQGRNNRCRINRLAIAEADARFQGEHPRAIILALPLAGQARAHGAILIHGNQAGIERRCHFAAFGIGHGGGIKVECKGAQRQRGDPGLGLHRALHRRG
ncbi:MAG: hypothetical protein MUC44_08890 [Beijerinckiaceae bacterium]|nr:hypothetical protein [Beijerinckiaceae bacterium]